MEFIFTQGESEWETMTTSIKEQLATLVALQHAETEIARIEQALACVDERIGSLNAQVTSFETTVNEGQAQLETFKKQYRNDEAEIKMIETQVLKSSEKLRSVKTNKEYQSMLKEIDDLKRKASHIEDQMLATLEHIETAEGEVASRKLDLTDLKAEIETQAAEVRKAADEQRAELGRFQQQRDTIMEQLAPKMQHQFARIKQQGQGIAVAAVVEAVCQVCRMNIPPQLFIELSRMNSMHMCPHCQRIIYPKALMD